MTIQRTDCPTETSGVAAKGERETTCDVCGTPTPAFALRFFCPESNVDGECRRPDCLAIDAAEQNDRRWAKVDAVRGR